MFTLGRIETTSHASVLLTAMSRDVKEFLDYYAKHHGGVIAPLSKVKLSPSQLARVVKEAERTLLGPTAEEVLSRFHHPESVLLVMRALWLDRLTDAGVCWEPIEGLRVEADEFFEYYAQRYGSALAPINPDPSPEQLGRARELFEATMTRIDVLYQLRKLRSTERTKALMGQVWERTLTELKRTVEDLDDFAGDLEEDLYLDLVTR